MRLKYLFILISCFLSLISFRCSDNLVVRDLNSKVRDSIFIYEIKMNHSLSEMRILRLQTYKYKKFINGQDLITYDYFDSIEKVDTKIYEKVCEDGIQKIYHDEMTGQIKMKDSHWMHPPRSEYFRVLELNAFPYFVNNKESWSYELNFGEHWGDARWIAWEGRKTSHSEYKLVKKDVDYNLGKKRIKCFKINVQTKIEGLGRTESIFYYNEEYGFVYMSFKTINNQIIEFKML